MSTEIQRSYSTPAGTLNVHYTFNDDKGKYKLESLTFKNADQTTQVALAKVWVNGMPAAHLKGFKSTVLSTEGALQTGETFYEIRLKDFPFKMTIITVKVLGEREQTLILEVPENLKGIGLKKIIAKQLDILDLTSCTLKHEGYPIDSDITLIDSGFGKGTELTLKLGPPKDEKKIEREKITDGALEKGGYATTSFVVPDTPKPLSFSKTAPNWRKVDRGLNLKAECTTNICKAFREIVYIPRGIGTFFINEENAEATCPECKNNFTKDVSNCVFWDCVYSFQGVMEDNTKYKQDNKIAPKDSCVTFEEIVNGMSTIKQWKYLKITTALPK